MKGGLRDHLAVCLSEYSFVSVHLSVYPLLIFVRKLMRSPCHLSVCVCPPIVAMLQQYYLSVCMFSLISSFSMRPVSRQRKVGDYFLRKLLVISVSFNGWQVMVTICTPLVPLCRTSGSRVWDYLCLEAHRSSDPCTNMSSHEKNRAKFEKVRVLFKNLNDAQCPKY
jgi:hypothetical protein